MNFRTPVALATTALFALTLTQSSPAASTNSGLQSFRTQLALRVKPGSGLGSVRVASALLGRYTRLSPTQAARYASLARAFSRRAARQNQLGSAMAILIRGLSVNYFKGVGNYNPKDPSFVRALNVLLSSIPPGENTLPLRNQISNQLIQINAVNGGTEEDAQFLVNIVDNSGPSPVS